MTVPPRPVSHLAPRDVRSTARSTAAFASAGAALLVVLTCADPAFAGPTTLARVLTLGFGGLLVVLSLVVLRVPHRLPAVFWVCVPLAVVVVTLLLDLMTGDASAGGQVILVWPMLYAANELRARAATAVLLAVLAADATIVLSLRPLGPALNDLAWVGTTAGIFLLLLGRSRDHEERLVAELTRQAEIDPLTGLATRRVLEGALQTALPVVEVALLLVDLDHFKQVNDAHGHPGGDQVLIHVATLLRQQVDPDCVVARLGGDELAVLLPGWGQEQAVRAAEQFRRRLHDEPPRVSGVPVPVTVSVGVAGASGATGTTTAQLYPAADAALYAAKRAGRDRVCRADALPPELGPAPAGSVPTARRPPRSVTRPSERRT